jgi:hypothetical protein
MQPICLICVESIYNRKMLLNCMHTNISVLKCSHTYHKKCLNPWIKNNPLCPYCLTLIDNYFKCYIINNRLKYTCICIIDRDQFTISSTIYPENLIILTCYIKKFSIKQQILIINFVNNTELCNIVFTGRSNIINKMANTIKTIYNY